MPIIPTAENPMLMIVDEKRLALRNLLNNSDVTEVIKRQ